MAIGDEPWRQHRGLLHSIDRLLNKLFKRKKYRRGTHE